MARIFIHSCTRVRPNLRRFHAVWDNQSAAPRYAWILRTHRNPMTSLFFRVTPELGIQFHANVWVLTPACLRTPSPEEHDLRLLRKALFPGRYWAVSHAKNSLSEPFLDERAVGTTAAWPWLPCHGYHASCVHTKFSTKFSTVLVPLRYILNVCFKKKH